ncbi:MAG: TonB family protein [Bacteroidota bacterium]
MHKYILSIISFLIASLANGQSNVKQTKFECSSTVRFPKEAADNNISGTVIVIFDIDSTCNKVNIRIEKSLGYGCDEEALRAISKCKNYIHNLKCIPRIGVRQSFNFINPDEE